MPCADRTVQVILVPSADQLLCNGKAQQVKKGCRRLADGIAAKGVQLPAAVEVNLDGLLELCVTERKRDNPGGGRQAGQ